MTSLRPRTSTRALRIGVMLADTLVAEHVVRSGRAFTIGQSIRNLVPLPVAGLPRRWQLLELVEHGVLLRLAPGMGARVSADGRVLGRADLDARGAHTRVATLVTVPAGAHGKIDLGEVRVLFQELRLPAAAPAPTLPRAVKGTLADRVDRRMAVFAAASLLVHAGIMTAAYVNDPPERASFAQRALTDYGPETVSIIEASDPILDLEPATGADPTSEPGTAPPRPTQPAPPSTEPPARPRPRAAQPTASDPRALAGDATRMADLLFDEGGTGAVDASMARRRPGGDLGRQLEEVRDSQAKVAIGQPSRDRVGDGKPRIGTGTDPVLDGVDTVTRVVDDKIERDLPTRITVIPKPPKQPGADIDAVVAKIRTTYMGGLQRCYKKSLGPQPTLTGKVTLTFELSEKGKVGDGAAHGVDEGFEDCVEGLMTRWSFTPVVDKDGDPIEVDIDVTLQLAI